MQALRTHQGGSFPKGLRRRGCLLVKKVKREGRGGGQMRGRGAVDADRGQRGGDASGVPGASPASHILRAAASAALTDLVTR